LIYLFLQAVFSSLFALSIKWVGNRRNRGGKEDIFVIGAINYLVAALAVLPAFLANHDSAGSGGAMWTGGLMGAVYFVAFFFVIYAIKWVGVSATTVVAVLAILCPITFAAFYWDEQPSNEQVIGIGLALVSLTLISGTHRSNHGTVRPWFAPIALITFFLLCGMSRLSQETFRHVSVPERQPTFLLTAFAVASLPSLAMLGYLLGYRRQRLLLTELLFGIGLGLSNILQSFFILKCLEDYPGYVVFPITSAGGILITTLVAISVLQERLNFRTYVGIGVAVVSLFLLY
jgi:drug/metabolite transporter (DMT)-like permease